MCVCVFVSGAQKLLMMVAYLKPEIIELVDKCSMVRRTHTHNNRGVVYYLRASAE